MYVLGAGIEAVDNIAQVLEIQIVWLLKQSSVLVKMLLFRVLLRKHVEINIRRVGICITMSLIYITMALICIAMTLICITMT